MRDIAWKYTPRPIPEQDNKADDEQNESSE